MSRWLRLVLILAALAVAFMLGYQAKAATRPQAATYDDAAFRPFPTSVLPSPSPLVGLHEYAVPVSGPAVLSASPSPQPSRQPTKQRAAGQAPRYIARSSHGLLGGYATWFATGRNGLYAAAGPALRQAIGPHWRGSQVLVARLGTTKGIIVTLNDWCACGPRNGRDTILDLSDEAFRALAPLSRGVIRVAVDIP